MKHLIYTLLIFTFFATACTKDETTSGGTSSEVINKFRSYFYNGENIKATKMESYELNEWVVVTTNADRPREVFSDITGMTVPAENNYDCTYVSADAKIRIRIKGNETADKDAVFAVLEVYIPECKEIRIIHIVAPDYFNKINSNEENDAPVIPVML